MPRAIDLSTVSPERAAEILRRQERELQRRKEYYLRNRDRIRAQSKAWHEANRDKARELNRSWKERNRERVRENARARYDRLTDGMVRNVFAYDFVKDTPLRCGDVPDEMIPLIRQTMLIKRELRKAKS